MKRRIERSLALRAGLLAGAAVLLVRRRRR
jgi:hypothetical protein